MTPERLEKIKGTKTDVRHSRIISELAAEIERLQANQKRLIEATNATLEYFRIEGQYGPEQRGFARLNTEGKLRAAIDRAADLPLTYQHQPVEVTSDD